MKIKTILFDGGEKGYQLSISETRRVVDLLENSKEFEEFVIKTRKDFNIPEEGFPFKQYKHVAKYAIENVLDDEGYKFFEKCKHFTEKIGFPYYWWSSVAYYVFYNVFFTPERLPMEIYYEESKEWNRDGLHLVLKENVSKTELLRLIKYHWDNIEQVMSKLPKNPRGHKMARAQLAKEICELKDKKDKSFRQIADELYEKYIDWPDVNIINEDYVKILYHRWKKKLSSLK